MARKKGRARKGKQSWVDLVLSANAGLQFAEPFIQRNVHGAVMSGDLQGAVTAGREAGKEAASIKNIAEAAGPYVLKKVIMRFVKVRSPKIGGRNLF